VPSAIFPEESNLVLNPQHPDAARLRLVSERHFTFDPRLNLSAAYRWRGGLRYFYAAKSLKNNQIVCRAGSPAPAKIGETIRNKGLIGFVWAASRHPAKRCPFRPLSRRKLSTLTVDRAMHKLLM